jgi:hypothetical protein
MDQYALIRLRACATLQLMRKGVHVLRTMSVTSGHL